MSIGDPARDLMVSRQNLDHAWVGSSEDEGVAP